MGVSENEVYPRQMAILNWQIVRASVVFEGPIPMWLWDGSKALVLW